MPRPLTRAQLLAEVQRLRVEAAGLNAYADELERLAEKAPLTIGSNRSKVGSNMQGLDVADKPENVRTAASRTRLDSEAKRALLEHVGSDGDVAKLLKIGRSTVQAYHSDRLPIPERHVAALAKKGVLRSVWKRVTAD